jgi:hypothetical protein
MDEIELDTSWIESYEKEENYYNMFYPESNKNIKTHILYINKMNELETIKEIKLELSQENVLKKEDFIRLIKETNQNDNKKYNLSSILVYNFTIENEELKNFLNNSDSYDFMTKLKYTDDYKLSPTLNCLQDVNNLYIILIEEPKKNNIINNNNTKRLKFNILHSKTKKHRPK